MSEQKEQIPGTEEKKYSEEEFRKLRHQAKEFYREEIQFLRLQEEYEKLLANIAEHKYRSLRAKVDRILLHTSLQEGQQLEEAQEPEPELETKSEIAEEPVVTQKRTLRRKDHV